MCHSQSVGTAVLRGTFILVPSVWWIDIELMTNHIKRYMGAILKIHLRNDIMFSSIVNN